MDKAIAKAQALIEALSYIRKFRDRIVVVKIGGAVMDESDTLRSLLSDVVFMATVGMQPIIVHGGGKAISAAMADAGLEVHFVQGNRYTDERALGIAEHVLVNQINSGIVDTISQLGGQAIGVGAAPMASNAARCTGFSIVRIFSPSTSAGVWIALRLLVMWRKPCSPQARPCRPTVSHSPRIS